MRLLILIASFWALVASKPELYKEKEDFQYSRSSSDDGSKSGYYGAQRGNMGGNYERAHNMDSLAQHHMSTVVRNVEGELGEGANTRTGSVFSAANSRGLYGSGSYDLSNLRGRNFGESAISEDSLSQSALSQHSGYGSLYSAANKYSSSQAQNSALSSGHQSSGLDSQYLQTDAQRAADNIYSASNYKYDSKGANSYKYAQSNSQAQSNYENSNSASGYDHQARTNLVYATPVRVYIKPGARIAIPVAAQVYDASLAQGVNTVHSDSDILDTTGQRLHYNPTSNAKHYESSYRYRKEWEKHDSIPVTVAPMESPIPKNSEQYEDAQLSQTANNQYESELASAANRRSSSANSAYLSGYSASTKNALSSQSRHQSQKYNSGASASNAYNYGTSSSNAYKSGVSDSNAYMHNGYDASLAANLATSNGLVEDISSKPKSYQSSYSYHKSWERRGDPYVIKPVGGDLSEQTPLKLTANQGYACTYCLDESQQRVRRDIDFGQQAFNQWDKLGDKLEDIGQQTQSHMGKLEDLGEQTQNQLSHNLEDLSQQTQDKLEDIGQQTQSQWGKLEDLGQQTLNQFGEQDLGQQAQNQWDNLGDLSQQTQNKLEDVGQQTQSHWGKLEDLGQQTLNQFGGQDLGQQTQNQWDNLGDLSQQTQDKLEDVGQQTQSHWGKLEDLGQHTLNQFGEQDLGQQAQNQWDNLGDLSQQTQNKLEDVGQQTQSHWGKLEDLGQQTLNQFGEQDLGQQAQNQWDNLGDLSQQTQNKLEDVGQQTQSHWGKLEDLGQQTLNQFGEQDLGQQTQNQWDNLGDLSQQTQDKLEDVGQQTQSHWGKLEDLGQQTLNQFGEQDLGQQAQNQWDNLGDLSQQTQNKLEDVGQQTQSHWGKLEDLGQRAQNKLSHGLEDFSQQTQDKLEDIGQQTQTHWDKLGDLGQQIQFGKQNQRELAQSQSHWTEQKELNHKNNWDNLGSSGHFSQGMQSHFGDIENLEQSHFGQQTQNQWDRLGDLNQKTHSYWGKLDDLGQQTQSDWNLGHQGQTQSVANFVPYYTNNWEIPKSYYVQESLDNKKERWNFHKNLEQGSYFQHHDFDLKKSHNTHNSEVLFSVNHFDHLEKSKENTTAQTSKGKLIPIVDKNVQSGTTTTKYVTSDDTILKTKQKTFDTGEIQENKTLSNIRPIDIGRGDIGPEDTSIETTDINERTPEEIESLSLTKDQQDISEEPLNLSVTGLNQESKSGNKLKLRNELSTVIESVITTAKPKENLENYNVNFIPIVYDSTPKSNSLIISSNPAFNEKQNESKQMPANDEQDKSKILSTFEEHNWGQQTQSFDQQNIKHLELFGQNVAQQLEAFEEKNLAHNCKPFEKQNIGQPLEPFEDQILVQQPFEKQNLGHNLEDPYFGQQLENFKQQNWGQQMQSFEQQNIAQNFEPFEQQLKPVENMEQLETNQKLVGQLLSFDQNNSRKLNIPIEQNNFAYDIGQEAQILAQRNILQNTETNPKRIETSPEKKYVQVQNEHKGQHVELQINQDDVSTPIEPTMEKPGFWGSVWKKTKNAKDSLVSWFHS